jgi:hypothetical protein
MRYNGELREGSEEGIMRAYMSNNVAEEIQPVYYYYIAHFFPKDIEELRIGGEIL